MISIIVCSIKPDQVAILKDNVARTIGDCEYEFVVIDNRETGWPIARAYNEGAARARFPYLLFAHEDIEFLSDGWGKIISDKLAEEDCGVIGFAGSTYKASTISGWYSHNLSFTRANYHAYYDDKLYHIKENGHSDFEQVIPLDGLALFVSKRVWEEFPFDEEALKGFHCYDIDFTMQIATAYKNYVTYAVDVVHKSHGNYDDRWFDASFEIMESKWNRMTPMYIGEMPDEETRIKIDEELLWAAVKMAYKCNSRHLKRIAGDYRNLPMSWNHFGRLLRLFIKYGR